MYESHHHDDFGDEVGAHSYHPREDEVTRARGQKGGNPSGSIFISWKADIVIILILLLASGLGIMWFISHLPFYLETASAHYYWAKDMYVTWGTPSVRWVFINFVVLTIVAASGLLSAFGGGDHAVGSGARAGSGHRVEEASSYKGHAYEGPHAPTYNAVGTVYHPGLPHPSYDTLPYNASSTRFSGPGYDSPFYNPHHQMVKAGPPAPQLLHDSHHRGWKYEHDPEEDVGSHVPAIEAEEEEEVAESGVQSSSHSYKGGDDEPPVDEISREIALAGDVREASDDETHSHDHQQMVLAPKVEAEEAAPEPGDPEPEAGGDSEAVESVSDVYDPTPEVEEADENEREKDDLVHHVPQHHQRTKTDSAIQFTSSEELRSGDSSPGRPHDLSKSHTFTIGRVLRRDQLVEFTEPFKGLGRKVRLGSSHRSSHPVELPPAQQLPREIFVHPSAAPGPIPIPHAGIPYDVGGRPLPHPERLHHSNDTNHHRRRHSAESVSGPPHYRRVAPESVTPRAEPSSIPRGLGQDQSGRMLGPDPSGRLYGIPKPHPAAGAAPPPPPPTLLKQRSIVYPPALLSHSSNAADSVSSPSSPPIQEAIRPPPPPPHLKLPSAVEGNDPPSSAKSVDKSLPSDDKKSTKQSRTSSSREASASGRASEGRQSTASSDEKGVSNRPPRRQVVDDSSDDEDRKEGDLRAQDREDSISNVSNDVFKQHIEDFLAKFHEDMRLERQESIARYRKRLEELDD